MTHLRAAGLAAALLLTLGGCGATPPEEDPTPAPATTAAAPGDDAPPSTTTAESAAAAPGTPAADATPPTGRAVPSAGGSSDAGPAAAGREGDRWRPRAVDGWQYQLSGSLDISVPAEVYVVDWEDTSAVDVQRLHAAGRRAICYLNAGAHEEWRPDAGAYPDDVLGAPLEGWPGERWLDVRRLDVLLPILGARMDVCRAKGFDAVDADNVDGYTHDTGFPLGADDQLRFNRAVAQQAHSRGLAVALKNDVEQVAQLEPAFDLAINEECLAYDECEAYRPFVTAGKPVLHVEYSRPAPELCARAAALGLSTIVKHLDLGPAVEGC